MTLAKINAQIAASRERLKELYRQRDAITNARRAEIKVRNLEILRLFDDMQYDSIEIARWMKLPESLVKQFLYSRGRTKRGRETMLSQLRVMQETQR